MAPAQSVCMIGGDGVTSYAKNSTLQSGVQNRLAPLVEAAIADLCRAAVPGSFRVADLGCSSGPNALALVSVAVNALELERQASAEGRCREISVYLNDLPENDFNTVFKELPSSLPHEQGDGPLVMVFGAPGSFYGRLFPAETLHLICSSFSLHWLSKLPQELVDGQLINKGNASAGATSLPAVTAAYERQFEHDFNLFLASRAKEMIPGGWMVLSLAGRPGRDLSSQNRRSEFIAEILQDMASRGVVGAEEVDAFNMPFYAPCCEELRDGVELEGSFEILSLECHDSVMSGPKGDAAQAASMARSMRVLMDWNLVQHFGVDNIGDEFARAAEERFMGAAAQEDVKITVLVISLRKRQP